MSIVYKRAGGYWNSTDTNLFDVSNETPVWLENIRVEKVEWKPTPDGPQSNIRALVVIYGWLPEAKWLIDLTDSACFEIDHKEDGLRHEYIPDNIFMRLSDCKIIGKKITNPVSRYDKESCAIPIYVTLECDMEVLL